MPLTQVAVYSGGGFAWEVAWLVQSYNVETDRCEVACFIDDEAAHGSVPNGISFVGLGEARSRFPDARRGWGRLSANTPAFDEKAASVAVAGSEDRRPYALEDSQARGSHPAGVRDDGRVHGNVWPLTICVKLCQTHLGR